MRRLPFFTRTALAATLVTCLGVGAVWAATGGGIASPGALSASVGDGQPRGGVRAHAGLARRCSACHPPPWSGATTSSSCLDCHAEVRAELASRRGLHARLGDTRRCVACHTEHGGSDAELTRLDAERFPHDVTGFSLTAHRRTSAGREFLCADCHGRDLLRFEAARCERCHRDYQRELMATHVAQWGADCRACHDGVDRFGRGRFDHGRTRLPLEGQHATLACTRCHEGVRAAAGFAEAPERCVDCHRARDVHAGRFGDDCARCHGAGAWMPATFDHARSGFPLTGAHVRAACAACHEGGSFAGTPRDCVACHAEPREHLGRFGTACGGCHGTDTWQGATFRHAFPLSHGSRAPVPCATCHTAGYETYTCYGCHAHTPAGIEREHREEGISDLRDCARCHPTGREHEGGGERGERGEHGEHGEGEEE